MVLRRWLALVAAVSMLYSLSACHAPPEPNRAEPRAFDGRWFTATIRRDVLSNEVTPTRGVTLYDFHVGSLPLLFAYVGDHAGYPHYGWAADREEQERLPSGLRAHCRYAVSQQGRARECLIALSERSPKQLMVFYDQLSSQWANAADAIIASIAPAAGVAESPASD